MLFRLLQHVCASGGSSKSKLRSQLKTTLTYSSSDGSSGDDMAVGDQVRHEQARVDIRSALTKEVDALKALRASQGSKYRRDPAFTLISFYDHMRATFYLHRRLDTVVQSAKVDEASCERDFSLSGRVFTPLRERMATGVGEQMVSIPLIAKTIPVTADQVLSAWNHLQREQKPKPKNRLRLWLWLWLQLRLRLRFRCRLRCRLRLRVWRLFAHLSI
jgi:hypothetical protein